MKALIRFTAALTAAFAICTSAAPVSDASGGEINNDTDKKGGYSMTSGIGKTAADRSHADGEESFFNSNLTGWEPINGTWTFTENGYKAVTAGGDTWAYAKDRQIPGDVSFIYEADIGLADGSHAAGIIFGVRDPESAAGRPSRLYSFLIARGDGNVMVFTHKDGSAEWIEVAGMTDADKRAETYHLRMVYLSTGDAEFTVNGTLYKRVHISGCEGGYPGLMVSAATTATFNNVILTETEAPVAEDISVGGAGLDKKFDPGIRTYWSYVPYSVKKITVNAVFDEDKYTAELGGRSLTSGTGRSVTLTQGLNAVTVTLTDKAGAASSAYTLNIVREPDEDTLYKEKTRPVFHFTPYSYQMNDPNGLVYNADTGEYHLFFQCNRPFDTGVEGLTGTTSWGHAVSKDLINWQELPLAITPDRFGMAWSGSAVIDRDNTSGLFDDTTPPSSRMVLFYASVGGDTTYGYAKESMAYSKDGGRTFIKYDGNPVVKNPGNMYGSGLRDPRVFRYEDASFEGGGIWVMVTVGDLRIFTSKDLINWKHCGRPVGTDGKTFDSECPDLYPLPVDGDENNVKWVYTGGGIFYIIGHMEKTGDDTVMFFPETDKIYALNGIADQGPGNPAPETYATQTFSSEKYGRRVSVSWLRDPSLFWLDKHWNSAQSIPLEHSLRTVDGKIKLFSYPVKEIDSARGDVIFSAKDLHVTNDDGNILDGVRSSCCDIVAEIKLGTATEAGFRLRMSEKEGREELVVRYDRTAGKLYVDKTKSGAGSYLGVYEPEMIARDGDRISLRILLDRICFDVYGNGGEAAVAGLVCSDPKNEGMSFFTDGDCVIESLTVYDMSEPKTAEEKPDTDTVTEDEVSLPVTDVTGTDTDGAKHGRAGKAVVPLIAAGAAAAVAALALILKLKRKKK